MKMMKMIKIKKSITDKNTVRFTRGVLAINSVVYNTKFFEFDDKMIQTLIETKESFMIEDGKLKEIDREISFDMFLSNYKETAIDTGFTKIHGNINIGVFYATEKEIYFYVNRKLIAEIEAEKIEVQHKGDYQAITIYFAGEVALYVCGLNRRNMQDSEFKIVKGG